MAFIGHPQNLGILTHSGRTFICPSRRIEVIERRRMDVRTVTMSNDRMRCLSGMSKLSIAVAIAFSLSPNGATAALIARNAHPPSSEVAFTLHSSNTPGKEPAVAALHVESGAGPDSNRVMSSADGETGDALDESYPFLTLKSVEHQSQDIIGEGHKSLGQRIADKLRSRGLPDELVVFLVSALPVVELRAGVPVGFVLNLHPVKVFLLAVLGNLAPIIPLMLLLRLRVVQRLAAKVLDRARKKASAVGNANSRAAALALFVGVPLPGTGAWTGSLVAFVLGMSFGQSLTALLFGVAMAACIMTVLCAMGRVGAIFAGTVILGAGISSMLRGNSNIEERRGDETTSEEAAETS